MIAKLRTIPDEQRLRLSLVPWEAYVAFCDGLGERHIRMTYDQGEMEIMTVSRKHERNKKRLGRLVENLTEELDIDIAHGGSMTFRNEEMLRALEPDECYWIAHEAMVRDRDEIDLDVDPPPDVTLEIEISRSTLDRIGIYAVLGVPEVWRWDGETLSIHVLTPRGTYRASRRSKAFPFLPMDEFAVFLTRADLSENHLIREFRAWVRENAAAWKIA
jgi:Uma2 family endonuclease